MKYTENMMLNQKNVLDNFVYLNFYCNAEKFTSIMESVLVNLSNFWACIRNSDPCLCDLKLVWTLICGNMCETYNSVHKY